jgi:hypothetical protein
MGPGLWPVFNYREHRFYRKPKIGSDPERKGQAWQVASLFKRYHCLSADLESGREFDLGDATISTQFADVVCDVLVAQCS